MGMDGKNESSQARRIATPALAPSPSQTNLSVLFTGFARGDLRRLRASVCRLGGVAVKALPTGTSATVNVRVVRAVVRNEWLRVEP